MKHQYDWDVATTAHFLSEHGLDARGFKLNIECNHAQLAGHSCDHEVAAAAALGLLGGLDANTGDPQVGWDTDQFLVDHAEAARVMLPVVRAGGFASPGGINFDAKLRRESVDVEDIVHAHVGSMDAMARGLRAAHTLAAQGSELGAHIEEKYASWTSRLGRSIESGGETLQSLEALAMKAEEAGAAATGPTAARGDGLTRDDLSAAPSARQEAVENIFNRAVASVV